VTGLYATAVSFFVDAFQRGCELLTVCGFAGILSFADEAPTPSELESMIRVLHHRGREDVQPFAPMTHTGNVDKDELRNGALDAACAS
jgi:hypothetical protein